MHLIFVLCTIITMTKSEINLINTKDVDINDATPAMQKFLEIKREHPDALLMYRMGDFYETFFEDAIQHYQKAIDLNPDKEWTSIVCQALGSIYAEVKGNTGQHWVAIDAIAGQTIIMMDPGSSSTDMWAQYDWRNTSTFAYFKAG